MSFLRLTNPARTLPCAIFAALAMVLLTPSGATAGCVHSGDAAPRLGAVAEFAGLARAGALAGPEAGDRPGPGRPSPCAHGACSRHQSSPLAPAPLDPGPAGARDVVLALAADFFSPDPAAIPSAEDAVTPIHAGGSVFRPPPLSH